jgi:hypothetical protein
MTRTFLAARPDAPDTRSRSICHRSPFRTPRSLMVLLIAAMLTRSTHSASSTFRSLFPLRSLCSRSHPRPDLPLTHQRIPLLQYTLPTSHHPILDPSLLGVRADLLRLRAGLEPYCPRLRGGRRSGVEGFEDPET